MDTFFHKWVLRTLLESINISYQKLIRIKTPLSNLIETLFRGKEKHFGVNLESDFQFLRTRQRIRGQSSLDSLLSKTCHTSVLLCTHKFVRIWWRTQGLIVDPVCSVSDIQLLGNVLVTFCLPSLESPRSTGRRAATFPGLWLVDAGNTVLWLVQRVPEKPYCGCQWQWTGTRLGKMPVMPVPIQGDTGWPGKKIVNVSFLGLSTLKRVYSTKNQFDHKPN